MFSIDSANRYSRYMSSSAKNSDKAEVKVSIGSYKSIEVYQAQFVIL